MPTQPKLLTDILDHLTTSPEARERFNSHNLAYCNSYNVDEKPLLDFSFVHNGGSLLFEFQEAYDTYKILIIQTALSNTPDEVAVCEFLGEYTGEDETFFSVVLANTTPKLNHLLYNTFTQALFHGKDFETALTEANNVYLNEIN